MRDWWEGQRAFWHLKRPTSYYVRTLVALGSVYAGALLTGRVGVMADDPPIVWLGMAASFAAIGWALFLAGRHIVETIADLLNDWGDLPPSPTVPVPAEVTRAMARRIDKRAQERPQELVYFIVDDAQQVVKIGYSTTPEKRLQALQTSNPNPLRIAAVTVGGWEAEQRLHTYYAPWRRAGEWFELTPELQAHIDELAAGAGQP